MKKLLASVIGLLLASAIGCSNNADTSGKGLIGLAALTGTGQVSFSFDETSAGPSKSIAGPVNAPAVTALVVTITDAADNIVYNAVSLPVTSLGGQYITQPLTLAAGSYHLTSFAAVNSIGEALYASPLEGSALAYLVSDPLPINFTITKNQVSKLVPEVLSTASYTAGDFGYGTFNFDIVETIDFLASVIVYNETSSGYELTDAAITVTSDTTTLYTGTLPAAITAVKVRDGYVSYTVTITKDGYADYTHTFTNAEIKAYAATPLTVTLSTGSAPEILTTIITEYSASDNSILNRNYSHYNNNQYPYLIIDNISFSSSLFGLGIPCGQNFMDSSAVEFFMSISSGANSNWLDIDDTLAYRFVWNETHSSMESYTTMDQLSMNEYILYPLNQDGYVISMTHYFAGPDTYFYTADDTAGPIEYILDAQNHVQSLVPGGVPGALPLYAIEYNGNLLTKITSYSWGTTTIINTKTIQYDVNNRPVSMRYYSDDEITQIGHASIDYNVSGRISKIVFYNNTGVDTQWNTEDDTIGVVSIPSGVNYPGYAFGNYFAVSYGYSTPLPVATFEYDQYGINTRINGYSDNEATLERYSIMEYTQN